MVWINVLKFSFFQQEPSRGNLWSELVLASVITVSILCIRRSSSRDCIFCEPWWFVLFLLSLLEAVYINKIRTRRANKALILSLRPWGPRMWISICTTHLERYRDHELGTTPGAFTSWKSKNTSQTPRFRWRTRLRHRIYIFTPWRCWQPTTQPREPPRTPATRDITTP